MTIFFLILSQPSILAINCVHASNWFTRLQPTRQTAGQKDNSVLTVIAALPWTRSRPLQQKRHSVII